ncbi:prevent-host-death protein [Candidatus Termititenax persephonae]|uniref:Prevent-host-death protein n=1 Tax=Candidatus Termititenax persephonae TaxID=2218525 RepID=A0A388TH89_9BACT|nr:prevent-host-death protein [Candidatus Termititenax persephonae]
MNFYTARDLRTIPKNIWGSLADDNEVVITNNGRPTALMLPVSETNFDETLKAIRQARAMIAFNNMRGKAAQQGFLTVKEIAAEIDACRKERRAAAHK